MSIGPAFISAWSNREIIVRFSSSEQSLRALQKAAQRIIQDAACQIVEEEGAYVCYLVKRDPAMFKTYPLFGITPVKPLPPKNSGIGRRFRKLVAQENSKAEPPQTSSSGEEVSLLAIFESLIAVSGTIALAAYLREFTHIVVTTLLAPFFLLRTSDVNDRILSVAHQYYCWIGRFTHNWLDKVARADELWRGSKDFSGRVNFVLTSLNFTALLLIDLMLKSIGILFGFQIIKVCLTVQYAICHPGISLAAIPANWRRIALSANSRQTPEVLPGIEDAQSKRYDFSWWRISNLKDVMWSLPEYQRPDRNNQFLFFVWLPAFIARFLFKSTTLFWSPLLWVAHPLLQTKDIIAWMRRICEGAVYRIQRWYSSIIIAAFALKILTFSVLPAKLSSESSQPLEKLLLALIVPGGIPPWHLAAVINAVITLTVYIAADHYVREARYAKAVPSKNVVAAYKTILVLRNLLSIYILICTSYIIVEAGTEIHWPPLQDRLFPWSSAS
jgi:hypothetical protein